MPTQHPAIIRLINSSLLNRQINTQLIGYLNSQQARSQRLQNSFLSDFILDNINQQLINIPKQTLNHYLIFATSPQKTAYYQHLNALQIPACNQLAHHLYQQLLHQSQPLNMDNFKAIPPQVQQPYNHWINTLKTLLTTTIQTNL